MHNLIVTRFKFSVNVDVLDIEYSEMLKYFIVGPSFDVLHKAESRLQNLSNKKTL